MAEAQSPITSSSHVPAATRRARSGSFSSSCPWHPGMACDRGRKLHIGWRRTRPCVCASSHSGFISQEDTSLSDRCLVGCLWSGLPLRLWLRATRGHLFGSPVLRSRASPGRLSLVGRTLQHLDTRTLLRWVMQGATQFLETGNSCNELHD